MKRLILFAHHDAEDRIRPYIVDHVKALVELGGELWFISNSHLSAEEIKKISWAANRVILRDNTGYDFGMWQEAIQQVDLGEFDELLLTNSSIAGPLYPLDDLFRRMAGTPCDFWGLTENHSPVSHLQSYFMVFRSTALHSPVFRQFWNSVLPYQSKWGVIHAYEIGLSIFLRDHRLVGLPAFPTADLDRRIRENIHMGRKWGLEALSSYEKMCFHISNVFKNIGSVARRIERIVRHHIKGNKSSGISDRKLVNPSIYYPDLLIRAGMPYVKIEVLRSNPAGLSMSRVEALLRSRGFDLNLVR